MDHFDLSPCGATAGIMNDWDRKVTKMKMISPSNREVDVGKTLNDKEWIGMCRREVRLSGLSALAASRSAVRR